jgi:succinate-semialdehyde dehydrogenase/glutarate-semialdehyde dehydrogenase
MTNIFMATTKTKIDQRHIKIYYSYMKSINPFNNQIISEYQQYSDEQVTQIIFDVSLQNYAWKNVSFDDRGRLIRNLSTALRQNCEEYANLITAEMGKVIKEARSEIIKAAATAEYYSENLERFLSPTPIEAGLAYSEIQYEPMGVILGVMPWNFPFWQVLRSAIPIISAGNSYVLKHASNVSGCALALEKLFLDAGFPENIFRTLLISSDKVAKVIANPKIAAVTVTGSVEAGRAVATEAAKHLKKCVLELGGNDPYIILKDADLMKAAKTCAESRLLNSGQSCVAAKRLIVEEPVYNEFIDNLSWVMRNKFEGIPTAEKTDIGPLSSHAARDKLHQQVEASVKLGAKLEIGGEIPFYDGAFYQPTILKDVTPEMPAFNEELFGPVASVVKANDMEDAIRLANLSQFGLGAGIFTADIEKAKMISKRLNAGMVFVNEYVRSDARLPFGGIKESGYGRELGPFGMLEFVNIKTFAIGR